MDFRSRNLTIPRGKVLFARFLPGTQTPGSFRELGNCPEFILSPGSNRSIKTYDSVGGKLVESENLLLTNTLTGRFTTDDMKAENLSLFLSTPVGTVSQQQVFGYTEGFTVSRGDLVYFGAKYGVPFGFKDVRVVSLVHASTTQTYQRGVDYDYYSSDGYVKILEGGGIERDTPIIVTYRVGNYFHNILSGLSESVEGELRVVSTTPLGPKYDVIIPRAALRASGDFAAISDPNASFASMSFEISTMQKVGAVEQFYIINKQTSLTDRQMILPRSPVRGELIYIQPLSLGNNDTNYLNVRYDVSIDGFALTPIRDGVYRANLSGLLAVDAVFDTGYSTVSFRDSVTVSDASAADLLWGSNTVTFSNNLITFAS